MRERELHTLHCTMYCTNTQIRKYANTQMYKYTNTQTDKCTNTLHCTVYSVLEPAMREQELNTQKSTALLHTLCFTSLFCSSLYCTESFTETARHRVVSKREILVLLLHTELNCTCQTFPQLYLETVFLCTSHSGCSKIFRAFLNCISVVGNCVSVHLPWWM